MADYQTHEHDVLVIGAGGAGLRAAIEASAAGVSVGLVCKSLLGKAHTVMAEGGIAAALANVDDRDNWKVHFADTMRGGQYVNNWRMAQLHAQEAPARVRELEAWGAVFDRTPDGRILQRNFGGHSYPRLAHVGDRTGLELIRTLQDHGIHQGIEVYMECTVVRLLKDGDRVAGAFGYYRDRGRFVVFKAKAVVLATGGIGKAYKITSNSWEYTGDGHTLAYDAGAELQDMEFVQFHPTGMIWPPSVRGILVTEGVRGEGGVLRNNKGERFMFEDIPDNYRNQTAKDQEEGWRYCQGDRNANRPPELLTRDHVARCIVREVKRGPRQPARRRLPRHFLDQGQDPQRAGAHQAETAQHVPPVQGAGRHRHHQGADGGRPDDALRHGRRARRCRNADVARAGPVRLRASAPSGINGANRLGGNSLSDLLVFGKRAGEFAAKYRQGTRRDRTIDADQVEAAARWRWLRSSARAARGTVPDSAGPAGDDAGPGRHRPQRGGDAARAGRPGRSCASGPRRVQGDGQPRVQPRLAHGPGPAQPADGFRSDHPRRARSQGEPRRPLPRRLSRQGCAVRQGELSWCAKGQTARCRLEEAPIPEMPAELKQIIEEMK